MQRFLSTSVLAAVFALFLFAAPRAQADFLLEPRFGYDFDTFQASLNAGTVKYNLNGPTIGLRLGFTASIFSFSVMGDYSSLSTTISSQPPGGSYESGGATRTSVYGVFGIKIPFVQAYGGYGIIDDWTFRSPSMSANNDVTFHGPGAIKVGLGFTGLPLVAINLEYTMTTFSKYSDGSDHDLNSTSTYTAGNATSWMAILSLPFQF